MRLPCSSLPSRAGALDRPRGNAGRGKAAAGPARRGPCVLRALGHAGSGPVQPDDAADAAKLLAEWQQLQREQQQGHGDFQGFPARFWSRPGDAQMGSDSWSLDSDVDDVPSPSNLPADVGGDLLFPPTRESLRRFGQWSLTSQPGIDLMQAGPGEHSLLPSQVYVILFGVGERDTEGIYSLRAFGEEGLPQETIIVFESEEDATRYAGLLEATMDHTPNVCSIPPLELIEFCGDQGYRCRLEPCGSLLIPPDYNVGVTDWERSMRLRDGRWAVLEAEPETKTLETSSGRGGQTATTAAPHALRSLANAAATSSATSALARYHPSLSDGELDHIRAQLERLLPPSEQEGQDGDWRPRRNSSDGSSDRLTGA